MSALDELAAELRQDAVIAPHVLDCDEPPALGLLVAAGPRAAEAPDTYTLLFEAIREGYLVHYSEPRLLDREDPDLLLLAGDYLYALGLERLAARGDLESVRELGDLISLSAQLNARDAGDALAPLWLAGASAVGCGGSGAHESAKEAVRAGDPAAAMLLGEEARARARAAGLDRPLADAADSIGFDLEQIPDRG